MLVFFILIGCVTSILVIYLTNLNYEIFFLLQNLQIHYNFIIDVMYFLLKFTFSSMFYVIFLYVTIYKYLDIVNVYFISLEKSTIPEKEQSATVIGWVMFIGFIVATLVLQSVNGSSDPTAAIDIVVRHIDVDSSTISIEPIKDEEPVILPEEASSPKSVSSDQESNSSNSETSSQSNSQTVSDSLEVGLQPSSPLPLEPIEDHIRRELRIGFKHLANCTTETEKMQVMMSLLEIAGIDLEVARKAPDGEIAKQLRALAGLDN